MSPASSPTQRAALPDLAGGQVQGLLDAVIGVASDLRLPDVLRRIVDSSLQLARLTVFSRPSCSIAPLDRSRSLHDRSLNGLG
jgi:hypothetical protein